MSAGFWKKLKVSGVWNFTEGFGLKVRQVSAGFGYGEGYYWITKSLFQYRQSQVKESAFV